MKSNFQFNRAAPKQLLHIRRHMTLFSVRDDSPTNWSTDSRYLTSTAYRWNGQRKKYSKLQVPVFLFQFLTVSRVYPFRIIDASLLYCWGVARINTTIIYYSNKQFNEWKKTLHRDTKVNYYTDKNYCFDTISPRCVRLNNLSNIFLSTRPSLSPIEGHTYQG